MIFSLSVLSERELNPVALNNPVDGTKYNFVEETFMADAVPEVELVNVKYKEEEVAVSLLMVILLPPEAAAQYGEPVLPLDVKTFVAAPLDPFA